MEDSGRYTVEEIFRDFKGRRAACLKALTTDAEDFHKKCNPETEPLCLYGHPSEQWEVTLPVETVPAAIPEPSLGINYGRDMMGQRKNWLSLVAAHSDSWLVSVAFFYAISRGFNKAKRKCLYDLINDLPTLFEAVRMQTEEKLPVVTKQTKEKATTSNCSSNKSKSNSKRGRESHGKQKAIQEDEEEEGFSEEDKDNEDSQCGVCGESYEQDEFWIFCEICELWFHGDCVHITPAMADHIDQYKCPSCSK